MNLTNWILLFTLGTVWGASFLFGRIIVMEISPLSLVFWRVAIAAIALYIYSAIKPTQFKISIKYAAMFTVMGITNNIIPFALIFYGQQQIGAGLASIVNAMTPIWVLIIAHIATNDEKIKGNKLIGIIIGFVGVILLIGIPTELKLNDTFIAQLAVLGATISYGIANVFGRKFKNIPPIETAKGQLAAATIIMIPIIFLIQPPTEIIIPSWNIIICIIALAILCTAIAYILFFTILSRAGAVNVSLVTLIVPISAIIMGVVVLNESLSIKELLAISIILFGLIIVDGRIFNKLKNK